MKRGAAGVAEAVKRPKRAAAAAAAAPAPSSEPAAAAAPKQPYAPRSTPAARRRSVPADPDTSVKRNADGSLHFPDHPEFRPRLTPRQVIQAGSWGGCYFNPIGGKPGIHGPVAVSWKDHPSEWFAGLPESMHSSRRYNVPTNFYGVKSGQGQKEWEEQGWIRKQDPRGFFQWYCRFFVGRRTEDDARQISRWTGVAGAKGRWKNALLKKVVDANATWDDASISPVIRQTLLHWAFEISEADVKAFAGR